MSQEILSRMTNYFSSFLDPKEDQTAHDQCNRWKQRLFSSSPIIIFMRQQLEKVGCKLDESHFLCSNCDLSRSGGFIPSHGILLCQNRLLSKQHLEDTITHELIHAFDHCTTTIDWNDCRQLACSEIRAISLSGECKFLKEVKRGHFAIAKQYQVNLVTLHSRSV